MAKSNGSIPEIPGSAADKARVAAGKKKRAETPPARRALRDAFRGAAQVVNAMPSGRGLGVAKSMASIGAGLVADKANDIVKAVGDNKPRLHPSNIGLLDRR